MGGYHDSVKWSSNRTYPYSNLIRSFRQKEVKNVKCCMKRQFSNHVDWVPLTEHGRTMMVGKNLPLEPITITDPDSSSNTLIRLTWKGWKKNGTNVMYDGPQFGSPISQLLDEKVKVQYKKRVPTFLLPGQSVQAPRKGSGVETCTLVIRRNRYMWQVKFEKD